LIAVGISAALDHGPDPVSAVLIALGGIIITMRLFFALRLDQRYTVRLEHEVAARTHSLQTLMGAVPDTILVLDADGRILETNLRYRATASSESGRREADLIGRSVFDLIDQAMR